MGRVRFSKEIICASILFCHGAYAQQSSVKIITWWGYLENKSDDVQKIEKKCNAKLSIDEFYSNSEFIDRINKSKNTNKSYEIMIYSDTVSEILQDAVNKKQVLDVDLRNYNSAIHSYFLEHKLGKNTGIFQLSLTGFLYNKKNIEINEIDSLDSIFRKVGSKVAVLVDDQVEIVTLLRRWQCEKHPATCSKIFPDFFPTDESLKSLFGTAKTLITADLGTVDRHPDFALAYTWSGDSIARVEKNKNLGFVIHPALSHTSMDIISLLGESKEAHCVARELSSKDFLDNISKNSKYFSPYGPVKIENTKYTELQSKFFNYFEQLGRIHRVKDTESKSISNKWEIFKINFGKHL